MDLDVFQTRYAISNNRLGEILGCSRSTIQKWRSGEVTISTPALRHLQLLDRLAAGDRGELERYVRIASAEVPMSAAIPVFPSLAPGGFDLCRALEVALNRLGSYIDRAGRVQQETAEEGRYREMVELQPDAVCRWLPDTTLTYVNLAYCMSLGQSRDELLGRRWVEFVPARDRERVMDSVRRLVTDPTAGARTYEHVTRGVDGREIVQEWTDTPVFGEDGTLREIHSIGHDITGRRELEMERDVYRERVTMLLDGLEDMVFTVGVDGRILDCNKAVLERLGYERDDLVGRPLLSLHPEAVRERAERALVRMLAGEQDECDLPVETCTGEQVPVRSVIYRSSSADVPFIGISRDLSRELQDNRVYRERARLESVLVNLSRTHPATVPEGTNDRLGSTLSDLGQLMDVGRVYLFRLDDEQQTMDNCHEWCAPGVEPQIDSLRNIPQSVFPWWVSELHEGRTIAVPDVSAMSGEAGAEQAILLAQDIRAVLVVPVSSPDAGLFGFLGVDEMGRARDWTDSEIRALTMAAGMIAMLLQHLRVSRELIHEHIATEQALEAGDLAFWRWHVPSGDLYFSDRWFIMLGLVPESGGMQIQDWRKRVASDDRAHVREVLADCLERGKTDSFSMEYRLVRADGGLVWVRDRGQVVEYDLHGRPVLLTGTMEDISAERERQSVMDNARRAAEEMQVAQAQFMANISHELRTPITAVMGLTELLSETELSFDAHTYVEGISTAAERLLHFTSALLDAVDLTTGTLRLNESDVLVSSVLEAVRFFFGRRADSQRLRFEISATEDVARRVFRGDSERVRQVLVSLADNAVKFARARVEVSASLVSVDGELRLAFDVRNDGPAIPEDIAHQVFALFLQEDGSLTRSGGGAGLGLFVARQTARLMGGDLVLQQNSRDQGVSFRFTLPVLPVGSQTAKGGGQSDGERDGRRVRVLVAEDTELTQVMLRRMLEKHGHDVAVAKDGAEAVAVWRTWEPDLVLMDIQMPVMDGYAATHDIRKAEAGGGRRHTPIIAVTAHVLSRDRQKCLDAGMDDFLGKPFQGSDLLKLVERYTAEASRSTGKS